MNNKIVFISTLYWLIVSHIVSNNDIRISQLNINQHFISFSAKTTSKTTLTVLRPLCSLKTIVVTRRESTNSSRKTLIRNLPLTFATSHCCWEASKFFASGKFQPLCGEWPNIEASQVTYLISAPPPLCNSHQYFWKLHLERVLRLALVRVLIKTPDFGLRLCCHFIRLIFFNLRVLIIIYIPMLIINVYCRQIL